MSGGKGKDVQEQFHRLPKTIVPIHYKLKLKPNLESLLFEGEEEITVKVDVESTEIVLNAAFLTVSNIQWIGDTGSVLPKSFELDEVNEILRVQFYDPLPMGTTGTLKLRFVGELNDKLKGFYRSKYKGPDGDERFHAVTHFEPTGARWCFPCWDEPAIRATFEVTLVIPKDRVGLSNMPLKSTTVCETDDNLLLLNFETTPVMSTYLVAIIVGEFDYLETFSSDGIRCRVYTPLGRKDEGQFALGVTSKVLPYYKDYFGIPYTLPKLDLIAIADIAIGAMENYGLITYRESLLLVDKDKSTAITRQYVALVVGHEVAHQWFGNLVALEWWTHLWLKEGFASFIEFLCVEYIFPEYDVWMQFATNVHNCALQLDALNNSHPIEVEVNHPKEIDQIFDDISYEKGASIIHMLHEFIQDQDFRKGLNLYLSRYQNGNAATQDLWKCLAEASGKPVAEIMSTWTNQMGFPLITVEEERQEGNIRVFELSQRKFCADASLTFSFDEYHWMVPLTFSTSAAPKTVAHRVLMDKERITVKLDNVTKNDWVKVNAGAVGFYRVRYPDMSRYIDAIKAKEMPPLDRLNLVDDLFAQVQAGQANTVEVLKLCEAFVHEDNYTVWKCILGILDKLNLILEYSEYHREFKSFGRHILSPIAHNVTWEPAQDEGHLRTMLRSIVLTRMATFEDEATLKEAKGRFSKEFSITPDLRSIVYRSVLSDADKATLEDILTMYSESDSQEEQNRIGGALAAVKNPVLLEEIIKFCHSDNVRRQDRLFVLISVSMNKHGRELVWGYWQQNWKQLKDEYPLSLVCRLVKRAFENFVTIEKATEIQAFFVDHPFPGIERWLEQAVEQIRLNGTWLKRDLDQVGKFLKEQHST